MWNNVALSIVAITTISLCGMQGVVHADKAGARTNTISVLSGRVMRAYSI